MSKRRPAPPVSDDEVEERDCDYCSDNDDSEIQADQEQENIDPVSGAVAPVRSGKPIKRKSFAHFSQYETGSIKRLSVKDFMLVRYSACQVFNDDCCHFTIFMLF